jgi:RHH-type proline utilization regulon transcriptional repressor/proline dehydrogenase/delta 1-pyrroline-5-carboxylate dehydrogenase
MREFLWRGGAGGESPVGRAIDRAYLAPEADVVGELLPLARLPAADRERVAREALALVESLRRERGGARGVEAFLREYDLGSREGVILMCIAEALLRIPDADTADRLIADKIGSGNWARHLLTDSLFVNASTWGLLLTGGLVRPASADVVDPLSFLRRLAGRLGEPVVRAAFRHAMRLVGEQFVTGRTIEEALARAAEGTPRARYTFDMLGESALSARDAERYFEAYRDAIRRLEPLADRAAAPESWPSISVKLSALHPRYEPARRADVLATLGPRLEALAAEARAAGVALTLDAEESERLGLSLELFDRLLAAPALAGWGGLGVAVQAYQKRALDVVRWLARRADETARTLNVRLVKGAYWDAEVKRAQERGLPDYPVLTRKAHTDVSFLACARALLEGTARLYPQFASHNAHTVAWVMHVARAARRSFEFQRLHGMGEDLYERLRDAEGAPVPCRVYAPVGSHEELLPYLVRRLLESGANTSFVHRVLDERVPAAELAEDPVEEVLEYGPGPHPRIPLPPRLFEPERANSLGLNLADGAEQARLADALGSASARVARATPLVGGKQRAGAAARAIRSPADRRDVVGEVAEADAALVDEALALSRESQPRWDERPAPERAALLERAAGAYEAHRAELVALCIREAGKTVPAALAEVREAVDFLRYYAARARADFGSPLALPGPTGESNRLELHGRGTFACISPWNFPLAIFTGQVAAALAAGNAVVAKPAEQTPLVAGAATRLLLDAGIPGDVLHLLPGGPEVGARLASDPRIEGVAFTGSTETARAIERALAARAAPLAALIAETGGQNAMIADSSALLEQLVQDAIVSAFDSAGQRCSALRVLFLQEDVAERALELLAGAMDELRVGDPALLETDVGPVIEEPARAALEEHAARMRAEARWHHRSRLGPDTAAGTFVAPVAVEIDDVSVLEREVFGPILHVVRFRSDEIDAVVDRINATGYGLTLGVHSRIDGIAQRIAARARVGNVYVNRNMIGAVVGVQPFGGRGLSGTGPKAGGPHYLPRFATERTVTVNTAAVGGNAALLALED